VPADSVSIRIYSGIARFPCDSMAFLLFLAVGFHINSNLYYYKLSQHLRARELITTVSQKETLDHIFYSNLNNKCPITIIFDVLSSQTMRYRMMVSIPITPSLHVSSAILT